MSQNRCLLSRDGAGAQAGAWVGKKVCDKGCRIAVVCEKQASLGFSDGGETLDNREDVMAQPGGKETMTSAKRQRTRQAASVG